MNREYLETLLKDFSQMLTTETVIGEPMVFGKVTIIPVVSVSFALGSGSGARPSSGESPTATGATAGAKLTPLAFLSIHEDGMVNIHHVKTAAGNTLTDRVLEMAPGFIDKLSATFSRGKAKGTAIDTGIGEEKQATPGFAEDFSAEATMLSADGVASVSSLRNGITAEVTSMLREAAQGEASADTPASSDAPPETSGAEASGVANTADEPAKRRVRREINIDS